MSNPKDVTRTNQEWAVIDQTITMMALMVTEELLFKSRVFDSTIRDGILARIQSMLTSMGAV